MAGTDMDGGIQLRFAHKYRVYERVFVRPPADTSRLYTTRHLNSSRPENLGFADLCL